MRLTRDHSEAWLSYPPRSIYLPSASGISNSSVGCPGPFIQLPTWRRSSSISEESVLLPGSKPSSLGSLLSLHFILVASFCRGSVYLDTLCCHRWPRWRPYPVETSWAFFPFFFFPSSPFFSVPFLLKPGWERSIKRFWLETWDCHENPSCLAL